MDILQPISTVAGVASGVAGLVLGILNFVHARDTTRPRLRVRPKVLTLIDRDSKSMENDVALLEIANVGHVPVVGSTIGFQARRKGQKGYIVVSPESVNGVRWPGELKPGNVTILRMKLDNLPTPEVLGRAFAKTIIDDIFVCSRRDIKHFRKELAQVRADVLAGAKSQPPARTAASAGLGRAVMARE